MRPIPKLSSYKRRRDFSKTPEPAGAAAIAPAPHLRYVIQKHAASHLHYDLRLEVDGVFKSWAIPKGPTREPGRARTAIEVEDHPLDYGDFEGTIPEGEYGGGTVLIWDRGYWAPINKASAAGALRRGYLEFVMEGERLHGAWKLRRLSGSDERGSRKTWQLVKQRDGAEAAEATVDDRSVASARTMAQIAAGEGPGPKPFIMTGGESTPSDAVWRSRTESPKQRSKREPSASAERPSRRRSQKAPPRFVEPQRARLVAGPPKETAWVHEVKLDGYRMHLRLADNKAQLLTRNGYDWTAKYQTTARAAGKLPAATAYIDGELCAVRPDGTTSFDELTAATDEGRTSKLVYFAFDLLYLDGEDLMSQPLVERKRRLAKLLESTPPPIRYLEHFAAVGEDVFTAACRLGVEGVVSKRPDAPYRSGAGDTWQKAKCFRRDEFIVVGFTDPEGTRPGVGALLMGGYLQDGKLAYAGRAGKGIGDAELRRLRKALDSIRRDEPTLDVLPPKTSRFGSPVDLAKVHWVKPELVAEVRYTLTESGLLRDGTYMGLRKDKPARDVRHPTLLVPDHDASVKGASTRRKPHRAVRARHVPPQNIMHLLPDAVVPDREQLESYWRAVGRRALKYLARRPLTLVRSVHGVTFFHKGPLPPIPDSVHQLRITKREGGEGVRVWVDNITGLLGLLDMDVVEIHPWGSTVDDVERPDLLIFDLDPGDGIGWEFVTETALQMRDALRELGYRTWTKTSGGKGMHVMVPVRRDRLWDDARAWARDFAAEFAKRDRRYTISSTVARRGRLFIDYLRNGRGSSAIGAFSPRARPGFPVSYPVTWAQVANGVKPDAMTMAKLTKCRR